jgi:hypothetical protein
MFEGLRKPKTLIVIVVTLLAYGCPIQAIVQAFGLDERTVASWRDRAGNHCQQVHQAVVQQGQLDLVHVQADEMRVKGRQMIAWMGLAMMVSTRLWLGGVVSLLSPPARAVGLYGWLERVSGQYPAGVSGEGQRDGRRRTSLFAGVAAVGYRCGDQTHGKETRGRNHAPDGSGNVTVQT